MNSIVLEADELLNEAIMSNTGIVVVEGSDDVPFYEKLFENLTNEIEVYAAENVLYDDAGNPKSCGEGCDGVLLCIDKAESNSSSVELKNYVLGIIDKDARDFRNTMPQSDAVLTLKYYSFESHFVTKEAIKKIVEMVTRATDKLFLQPDIDSLYNRVVDEMSNLYYLSLEALKNSCVPSYTGKFGYSTAIEEIKNRKLNEFSQHEISELDAFAMVHGLTNNHVNILKIVKGKWLLIEFCRSVLNEIGSLKDKCKLDLINQCQYCAKTQHDKCLYKEQISLKVPQVIKLLMVSPSNVDMEYVKQRAGLLAA